MAISARHWLALVGFVVLTLSVAALSGAATADTVRSWYPSINKPSWTPPSWLFGPVWTLLYLMMAVAAWLVWRQAGWGGALVMFGVQLLLNALWSPLFFGWQQIGWAFVDIVALWLAILATTILFWQVVPAAGILFLPYLAWVSFATALNFALWRLNV
jgi:tryptophan-rich sensory protein